MMMRKRNKRKYHLRIAAVMILLLAITNTATYRITEQYIQGKENVKEIAYKGSNTVSIKNVTKKLNPASFKIDHQLVKQIKNVMIIAHPDDETLWAGDHIMKDTLTSHLNLLAAFTATVAGRACNPTGSITDTVICFILYSSY